MGSPVNLRKLLNRLLEKSGNRLVKLPSASNASDRARYQRFDARSLDERRFLNVGAGSFQHPYWTNVDMPSEWYEKVQPEGFLPWNLMSGEPMPYTDNSAEIVYSSHTLEHVSDAGAENFFRETYRTLKPGGTLRLTMPDMALAYTAYQRGDRYFFHQFAMPEGTSALDDGIPLFELFLARFAGSTCQLWSRQLDSYKIGEAEFNETFDTLPFEQAMERCTGHCSPAVQAEHPQFHMNWWTHDKCTQFLQKHGFTAISVSGYGQSRENALRDTRNFDTTMPPISMYMEAEKPR